MAKTLDFVIWYEDDKWTKEWLVCASTVEELCQEVASADQAVRDKRPNARRVSIIWPLSPTPSPALIWTKQDGLHKQLAKQAFPDWDGLTPRTGL